MTVIKQILNTKGCDFFSIAPEENRLRGHGVHGGGKYRLIARHRRWCACGHYHRTRLCEGDRAERANLFSKPLFARS